MHLQSAKISALGELLAATGLVEANLLTFDFTGIAGDETGLGQRRLQGGIELDQRTGDAVTNSPA